MGIHATSDQKGNLWGMITPEYTNGRAYLRVTIDARNSLRGLS